MTTSGVEWVETQFGPRPEWANGPDHEAILQAARQALNLNELCSVRFLSQGVFSRVYIISSFREEYIFRLSLPLYRRWKTESEIATMEWSRINTSLPVPRILAHMNDPSQAAGYEWIIMEKGSGKPLEDAWADMDYSCKSRFIKQLAAFSAGTFEYKLRGMGSFVQGPGGIEALSILQRLGALLDAFFPPHSTSEPEPTMLYHHGLNEKSILVDDDGSITSVIDWECMSTMPLFLACDFPEFLIDDPYHIEPNIDDYDEGLNDPRYWTHYGQYELTRLREVFLDEMKKLCPKWVEIFESSQHQRDFFEAITTCREHHGDPMMCEILGNWLTDMESGATDAMGLTERLFEALNLADTLSERSEDTEDIEMGE